LIADRSRDEVTRLPRKNMDLQEAKKIFALYLTGQNVPEALLEQARQVVRSDQEYTRYLSEEVGMSDNWIIDCEVFLSHLAEFSEMTAVERRREMPELTLHVERCNTCRQAYWEVNPLWTLEAARSTSKELAQHIKLTLDNAGWLREQGPGPPSVEQERVGAELRAQKKGDLASGASWVKEKEWRLSDEEANCTIHLFISGQPNGEAMLRCEIEYKHTPATASGAKIEVREVGSGSLLLDRSLSDLQSKPIHLLPGSWKIKLQSPGDEVIREWIIPLELKASKKG
jgi:hypothetical protein